MKKLFNLKIKLSAQKIEKYIYFLLTITALSCLFWASMFLYDKFYLSITQSKEVVVLKEKVAPETIDINAFENIIKNIKEKTGERNAGISSNPFE